MSRFARVAALLALVAALYCRVQAAPWPPNGVANLDPVRMFDPAADSMLAALFTTPKELSPLSVAIFYAPDPNVVAVAAPIMPQSSQMATVRAVTLRAYVPPVQLPNEPLGAPSVTPAQAVHPQVVQTHVRASSPQQDVRFGNYTNYAPSTHSLSEDVHVPVRIGGVHFAGVLSGTQSQSAHTDSVRAMQLCGTTDEAAACPYLHDERTQLFSAGTNFDVRAGNARFNLQLSGSVGRVNSHDTAMYQYVPLDPDPQLDSVRAGSPQDTSLLYYPGLTQMVRHGLDARVAVPISPALTVGLQYDRAHYQGNYATMFAPGLDARKDTYLGNVTYQLPNSNSLLTLSAQQYRYQDNLAPFNLTETRADLSFTVKF